MLEAPDAITTIALAIENAHVANDEHAIRQAISAGETLLHNGATPEQRPTLHYFLGIGWDDLRVLRGNTDGHIVWKWQLSELEEALKHYRLAIAGSVDYPLGSTLSAQLHTNLANLLNTIGRSVEAIAHFDAALAFQRDFAMALGNKAIALRQFAISHYDQNQQLVILRHAYDCITVALHNPSDQFQDGALAAFRAEQRRILEMAPAEIFSSPFRFPDFDLGTARHERDYRAWSLRNRLFLNPLNDVDPSAAVTARDTLTLPAIVGQISDSPVLQGMFNQLKEEFVMARLLLWEGSTSRSFHFADREVTLVDVLDYASHSVAVEKLRLSFRSAYSLMDKLSFLLNRYLNLHIPDDRINLNRIWFRQGIPKRHLADGNYNPDLIDRENWPLRGLYWLARDLYDDGGFVDALEPNARDLKVMRDHLEHKYLKVHNEMIGADSNVAGYSVLRSLFQQRALKLLQLVRSAFVYACLAIHQEEHARAKARPPQALIMPQVLLDIPDANRR